MTTRRDLESALAPVMDAYFRANPEQRDSMFVGALCQQLLRELGNPNCSYVVAGVACAEPASWDASGRALCEAHAVIVETARQLPPPTRTPVQGARADIRHER